MASPQILLISSYSLVLVQAVHVCISSYMSVPSLESICLDCLAENAGYIVDLDGVPSTAVLNICTRTTGFGLLNLESVLSEAISNGDISVSHIWADLAKKAPPTFIVGNVPINVGLDYHRQVITASLLREYTNRSELDPEDFQLLLENAGRFLTFAEMHRKPATWLQPALDSLKMLKFLDISQAGIGPQGAVILKAYIIESQCLQGLDANRNQLTPAGAAHIAEAITASTSLRCVNLAFNGLGLAGVEILLRSVERSATIVSIDLTRNLFGKDVAAGTRLSKSLRLPRIRVCLI